MKIKTLNGKQIVSAKIRSQKINDNSRQQIELSLLDALGQSEKIVISYFGGEMLLSTEKI